MEENTPLEPIQTPDHFLELPEQGIKHLETAAKWAKFLSIVGFISAILMLISGFFVKVAFSMMPDSETFLKYPFMKQLPFFYFLCSIFYFIPSFFLNRFSNKAPKAIRKQDSAYLVGAFGGLKNFFMISGILVILGLAIFIVMLIVISVLGVGMMHSIDTNQML